MKIKFCKMDDGKIAVGTGKRPAEFCRECYVAVYGSQFQAWQVTEQVAQAEAVEGIACAKTGETVGAAGATVWLDPVETNIPALVYGGFVKAIPEAKAPAKAAKSEG